MSVVYQVDFWGYGCCSLVEPKTQFIFSTFEKAVDFGLSSGRTMLSDDERDDVEHDWFDNPNDYFSVVVRGVL